MNIRKKWIAMVLAFTMAVSPLPGAAVRAESGESAGEEVVVLETAEKAEAGTESLGEAEVQAGETADELDEEGNARAARYSYTWFYVSKKNGADVEIGTEGEEGEEELGNQLVEKYNEGELLKCQCRDLNGESSELLAEVYPSVSKDGNETFAASCKAEGKITFVAGFNFGEHKLSVTLPIDPNAHTKLEYEALVDATCEKAGHVAGHTCQGCGKHFEDKEATKIIEDQDWIIPAGHDWTEWKVTIIPTCKKKGERIRTCRRDESHVEREELPEDPNAHTLVTTDAKDPTCTEAGNTTYYTCQGCGKYFADSVAEQEIAENSWIIPAGHDWREWEVTKIPTCKEKGERIRTCQRDESHVEREELPEDPQAHKLTTMAAIAPTCTEAGNITYYTCMECGKCFSDPGAVKEIEENSWVVPAKGHMLKKTAAKAATCTAAGNSEYYTCKECGKYYADANGKKEIKQDSWVIKAKGHQIREKETKPTVSKEGSLVCSCAACGYVQEKYTLPRTALKMTMGSSKKIISKAEGCTFAVPKSAKKYLSVSKTGKIAAKKKPGLYKDVKKLIPVKVKIGGKSYTVKVKPEIPAPNIKITKTKVTVGGRRGYRYIFQYDLAGATKIKVRIREMKNDTSINNELDQYSSSARSDSQSYIGLSFETLKKLGNKVTFEITAYYGKRASKVRKIVVE